MSFSNDKTINDQVEKALKKKLTNGISRAFSQDYVDELKKRIVKRTQLGTGIGDNNNSEKIKTLTTKYKATRSKKRGALASTTTPAKSNLTATGQLLKSLTNIKVRIENGIKFIITVSDKRGLDINGKQSKIGNKKLVDYQEAKGRRFLGFTKPQINQITREIRQKLINLLK